MCDNTTNCGMDNPKSFSKLGTIDLRLHTGSCAHDTNTTPRAETSFYNRAVNWADDLAFESNFHGNSDYTTLLWIGHIGFYVCKPNSCHAAGLAMDLTRIQWNGCMCGPCQGDHAGTRTQKRRYLAVDAQLRRYFKWTLDGWYTPDPSHQTHIHASSHFLPGGIVLDQNSQSDTFFVQAVCNNFNGAGLAIDGDWGSATQAAWVDINAAWDFHPGTCNPFTTHGGYDSWLHHVVAAGFADIGASQVTNIVC